MKAFSYHIVTSSPWPVTTTISLFSFLLSIVTYLQGKLVYGYNLGSLLFFISFLSLAISLTHWWKDVHFEASYLGEHPTKVQTGLNIGFILFIISEVLIFLTLFFAYFYNALVPSIESGNLWPPVGIITLDYKAVPLLNTFILLASGFTITASHNYLLAGHKFSKAFFYLLLTIILGAIFSYFQYFEYYNSFFTFSDSVFGSSFYFLTGVHGAHIIVGSLFLIVTALRFSYFTNTHHLLFSFSAIYWHLVDALWIFIFFFLYFWPSF